MQSSRKVEWSAITQGNDSSEIFDAVRRLHFSHEMFLYHQSAFNTPRYSDQIETEPPILFGRMYLRLRRNQYKESRIMGQYEEAQRFYWRPKE